MANYPTETRHTMHRRTQWLTPDEPTGDITLTLKNATNLMWAEAEALSLRNKGFDAEVKVSDEGKIAVFATGSFISHSSEETND